MNKPQNSIRVAEDGEDFKFEITCDVAGNPFDAIMLLLRATSALIAAAAKDGVDPQKVGDTFANVFAKHIAQDIQDRRAEDGKEGTEREQERENKP